jgi:hypothetical protein
MSVVWPDFKTLSTQPVHKYLADSADQWLLGASSGAFEYFMPPTRYYYY